VILGTREEAADTDSQQAAAVIGGKVGASADWQNRAPSVVDAYTNILKSSRD
jgi:hypothetical protein